MIEGSVKSKFRQYGQLEKQKWEESEKKRDEKLHAVVARSAFASTKTKNTHVRSTFGSGDVEKVHTVVARSTSPSQNAQSTHFSEHFWKLRCRKSARRCGAKHISKSECAKHIPSSTSRDPLQRF